MWRKRDIYPLRNAGINVIFVFSHIFQMPVKEDFIIPEVKVIGSEIVGSHPMTGQREFKSVLSSLHGKSKDGNDLVKSAKGLPPWRDSDRHPTDIIRFNYLDNLDPVEHARIT